jgi:flagellar L-ring protein precursor FlgH
MKCSPSCLSSKALRIAPFAVAALALSGCSHFVHKPVVAQMPPVEIPAPPPPVPNGAIFQAASYGNRPLFEDQRPRMPGDVLTVVFNEQVSASKNAQASASRKSESSFDPTVVPNGLKDLGKLGIDLKGGHDFQGSGGAKANNTFSGTITVTVVQVLNNGNLRVHLRARQQGQQQPQRAFARRPEQLVQTTTDDHEVVLQNGDTFIITRCSQPIRCASLM